MRLYWRVFNIGMRLVGSGFAAVGLVLIITHPGDSGSERAVGIVVSAVVMLLGIGLLLVRPYRPDLGDAAWGQPPRGRSWLTGDPKDQAAA